MQSILNSSKALIVCPNNYKKYLLKNYGNNLIKAKFITIENLVKKLTFDYTDIAIIKVSKKFNINNDVAKMYIDSLIYLDIIKESKKLDILRNIYDYLKEENLIVFDRLFVEGVRDKKIYVCGYSYLKKEYQFYLSKLDYEFIELDYNNPFPNKIYKFHKYEEEVFYVLEQISTLIKNNVNINDIKIVCRDDLELVKRFFLLYNIPLNYDNHISLSMVEDIIKLDLDNLDLNNIDIKNQDIKEQVINIINRFPIGKYDDNVLKEYLKYNFKKTKCKNLVYKDAIEIIDIEDLFVLENKHIFILGFSQGTFPYIHKDEEYFKDVEVRDYLIDTSLDKNKNARKEIIKALKTNNQIYLSMHTYHDSNTYYLSSLVNDLGMKVIEREFEKYSLYSDKYNKYIYSILLDGYTKFGTVNKSLEDLNTKYDIDYMKYDNRFTGLDLKSFINNLNGELNLSYTAIDSYYKCAFQYYVARILKLDIYEETFPTFIGSLFHEVLKYAFTENFIFDDVWNNFIASSTYELSSKEKHLLIKLKEELNYIIEIIKDQNNIIGYKDALYEERVNYQKEVEALDKKINVNFVGIIDKLYYKSLEVDGKIITYVSVVDYKTGNLDIKLDLVDYGLSLQLPIYLFLSKKIDKLPNVYVYGFYLQNILRNEIAASDKEEYEKIKKKNLKLNGYTVDSIPKEFEFDYTKENSQIIDGLKKKNDGTFYASSKVLTKDAIDDLYKKVDRLIDEAVKDILSAKFTINPKVYEFDNLSCKYCKFSDICYHTYKDNVYLKKGDK